MQGASQSERGTRGTYQDRLRPPCSEWLRSNTQGAPPEGAMEKSKAPQVTCINVDTGDNVGALAQASSSRGDTVVLCEEGDSLHVVVHVGSNGALVATTCGGGAAAKCCCCCRFGAAAAG